MKSCVLWPDRIGGLKSGAGLLTLLRGKLHRFPSLDIATDASLDVQAAPPRSYSQGDASMIRYLTTLILSGILGSMVLVGNAEACHKRNCGHVATVCIVAPAPCVTPVACCKPAPCPKPVVTKCRAPKVRTCKITLPKLCLPKLCVKKCPPPVVLACAVPVYYAPSPVGYPVASPQTSAQH